MTIRRGLPLLLFVALVAGCGFLKPQQKEYYALAVVPASGGAPLAGAPLAVGSVELPPGLDRREVVVRETGQRLDPRGTELWAGPLEAMIVHTLAFDLARRLPEGMVVLPGAAKPPGAIRSLYLVVERFDAGPDARIVLDAHWSVGPATSVSARRERIELDLDSLESGAIAEGMSRALGVLADRIVAAIGGAP